MQNDALNVSVNQQERTVTQVVIESKRSYDEVIQTFEANTHHITTDQFFQLVKNATTFAEYAHSIDMVLGEKRFLRIWDAGVGFYVPFRVYFSEDTPGYTHIIYDQPSSFLRQFNDADILKIATALDTKVADFLTFVAQGA